MSDPGFVVAAYAVVIGGLVAYVASVIRRARAARRRSASIDRQRGLDRAAAPPDLPATGSGDPAPTRAIE